MTTTDPETTFLDRRLETLPEINTQAEAEKYIASVKAHIDQLQADIHRKIAEYRATHGPEWTEQAFAAGEELGTRAIVSGGEVMELGPQEGSDTEIPF